MNYLYKIFYDIFSNKTTFNVVYLEKQAKLYIKRDHLKILNCRFPYNDIHSFGYNSEKYIFELGTGESYSFYTSKANDIYNKVNDNCVKLANKSIPIGEIVEIPISSDLSESDTIRLIPFAQTV